MYFAIPFFKNIINIKKIVQTAKTGNFYICSCLGVVESTELKRRNQIWRRRGGEGEERGGERM